jgi:hypothetical protein
MLRHQRNQSTSPRVEEWIGPNHERTHVLLGKTGEGRVDILVGATIQNNKPLSEAVRRLLHISRLPLSLRAVLIHKQADQLGLGYELPQQSEPLCSQQGGKKGGSRYIRAGPIETRDKPYVDWVFSYPEDDRNIGMVLVAALAARGVWNPATAASTARGRPTSSDASAGRRSK